jgi:Ni/Fe-hydrogenase subunit HybB-like protein
VEGTIDPNRPDSYAKANRDIIRVLLRPNIGWISLFLTVTAAMLYGGWCWWQQLKWGMGVANTTHPTMWGIYIVTFVFWVGIGHAGTLISAVLFLVRSRWRTGVYRASEAMTVFAVMTALLFPMLHLGRVWQVYWFFPYPNQRYLWMNFKSPLMWDVFAISTYFTVSTVFFFVGLAPDFADLPRPQHGARPQGLRRPVLRLGRHVAPVASLHGGLRLLRRPRRAAGPLGAQRRLLGLRDVLTAGWHSTIFPPYFVAGAIFSGCGMVITCCFR